MKEKETLAEICKELTEENAQLKAGLSLAIKSLESLVNSLKNLVGEK